MLRSALGGVGLSVLGGSSSGGGTGGFFTGRRDEAERKAAWQKELSEMQANNSEGYYINPSDVDTDKYEGASNVMADLHRAQFKDWEERYAPRIIQLSDYAKTGSLTNQQVGLADQSVQTGFQNAQRNQQMHNQGLGIQQTQAQQQASDRRMELEQTASRAQARNQARVGGQDRDMQILAGGGGLQQGLQQ